MGLSYVVAAGCRISAAIGPSVRGHIGRRRHPFSDLSDDACNLDLGATGSRRDQWAGAGDKGIETGPVHSLAVRVRAPLDAAKRSGARSDPPRRSDCTAEWTRRVGTRGSQPTGAKDDYRLCWAQARQTVDMVGFEPPRRVRIVRARNSLRASQSSPQRTQRRSPSPPSLGASSAVPTRAGPHAAPRATCSSNSDSAC